MWGGECEGEKEREKVRKRVKDSDREIQREKKKERWTGRMRDFRICIDRETFRTFLYF